MPPFSVNVHRRDPYKNFKFQIVIDGQVVPGVSKVSALKRATEVVLHRDGGSLSHLIQAPGLTSFEPITLERGITHDTTFEHWAELAYSPQGDAAMSLKNFRKDMVVKLLNQQGSVVLAYIVRRCWVSEYQALPELDANGNTVAIETITIQHEGFERDQGVTEPAET